MKQLSISKTVILFAVLAVAGICLIVLGQGAVDSTVRSTLPYTGSAIFGASLAFFLIKMAK